MTFDGPDTGDSHFDDIAAGDAPESLGPAMQELSPLQRRFVWALFETPPGPGSFTRAAKRAGYGKNSSHKTLVQMAHMLWRNEKIRRAYQEMGHKYIGHAAVAALKAVHELVLTPSHPDHLKACRIFIDRGWPAESLQRIDVQHTHKADDREAMEIAIRFAAELGVPVEKLLGASRPKEPMKLIYGSATEVKPASELEPAPMHSKEKHEKTDLHRSNGSSHSHDSGSALVAAREARLVTSARRHK